MRKLIIAAAATFAFAGLAACQSPADETAEKQADAIEAQGEAQAESLEAQAAAAPTEAGAAALENEADRVEASANAEANRVEQQAGNADGGMTTSNTPSQ